MVCVEFVSGLSYIHPYPRPSLVYGGETTQNRCGHELLVRSGGFSLCTSNANPGEEVVIRDAFVCIPASQDRTVRSALGVPLERLRSQ